MAEGWRQKRVDIVHWLQAIQPPSPEPFQESDGGLNFNPDAPNQGPTASISQLSTSESQDLADNTKLLYSSDLSSSHFSTSTSPKLSPVREPLATVSIQSPLEGGQNITTYTEQDSPKAQEASTPSTESPEHTVPGVTVEQVGPLPGLKCLRQKSLSPLPLATHDLKLPVFGTFDDTEQSSDDTRDEQRRFNQLVNRPPINPMKLFSRASTAPRLGIRPLPPMSPTNRKGSSPVTFNTTRVKVDSSLVHHLRVSDKNSYLMSRRKSLSQDDISQLVEKDTTPNVERHSSCSDLKGFESRSNSQSSTGACGYGSNVSEEGSSNRDSASDHSGESPVNERFTFKRGTGLSPGSVDALESRLRERLHNQDRFDDDELLLPSNSGHAKMDSLVPPLTPSLKSPQHRSNISHSPSPPFSTPPTSPYHTPIVPLGVRFESRQTTKPPTLDSVRKRQETERGGGGISMSRLKKFNLSQQFSFDTTNEDMFSKPSNQPKFLKNSILTGASKLSSQKPSGSSSHVRSFSDVSSTDSPTHHQPSSSSSRGATHTKTLYSNEGRQSLSSGRQYRSQLDLYPCTSFGAGGEASLIATETTSEKKPLKLFEQLQLRKSQTECKSYESSYQSVGSESGSTKNKVLRQDSGLGTLSINSQKF